MGAVQNIRKRYIYIILALLGSWFMLGAYVKESSGQAALSITEERLNANLRVSDGQLFYMDNPVVLQGYGDFVVVTDPEIIPHYPDGFITGYFTYQYGTEVERYFYKSNSSHVLAFIRLTVTGVAMASGEWGDDETANREDMPWFVNDINGEPCLETEWDLNEFDDDDGLDNNFFGYEPYVNPHRNQNRVRTGLLFYNSVFLKQV
ncbi:hypothetical protein JXQ70_20930 [bacterium]|nr:hypothetical protein [bacterium]